MLPRLFQGYTSEILLSPHRRAYLSLSLKMLFMSNNRTFLKSCSRHSAAHILESIRASTGRVFQVPGWLWELLNVSWASGGGVFVGTCNFHKIVLSLRSDAHFGTSDEVHISGYRLFGIKTKTLSESSFRLTKNGVRGACLKGSSEAKCRESFIFQDAINVS